MVAQKTAQTVIEKMGGAPDALRLGADNVDAAYINSLKPAPGGEGLVMCEPVADAVFQNQRAWGAGAARWLQIQVAGQPTLGQTPSWGWPENARCWLNYPDLALNSQQAQALGKTCGVSHVGVGTLSGTAGAATLAYQLVAVADGKVIGSAKISGPLDKLGAQLPQLARALARQLKINATVPPQITLSADDLKFLGTPRIKAMYTSDKMNAADQKRLKVLVGKDPLAGVMAQRWCDYSGDAKGWQNLADTLRKQAPNNALVWGEVAFKDPMRIVKASNQLAALQTKYPANYMLAQAGVALERGNRARPLQVSWAEAAVRAAPGNSYAWCDLSDALFDESQALRRSRYARDISAAEWRKLNGFYQRSHAAALKATQVEPKDSSAWAALAQAATFNGDSGVAKVALDKALALDGRNRKAWGWGMQMMQPKWSGSNAQFITFATRAAAHADDFYFPAEDASGIFYDANQRPAFKTILQTVVAKDPTNVEALTELGAIYHYDDRSYRKAEALYRQALGINPNYGRAMSTLGDLTYWVHNDPKGAEALYKSAIATNPKDGYFHANLGRMYALTGRQAQGVAEANLAKKYGFRDAASHPVWQATGVSPPGLW